MEKKVKKIISIVLIVLMVCFLGIGSYATETAPDKAPEQNSSETNVGGSDAPTSTSTTEEYNFSGVIIIGLSLGLIVLMSIMQVRKERR